MTNWPIFALILLIVILLFRLRSYWARESREIHSVHDVLLDPEKLIIHAKEIAINHAINGRTKRARCLLRRLEKNFRRITFVYKNLSEQSRENRDLSPSAEWLLDNFYLIEEQVQEVKGTFSQEKYSQLKILSGGYLQGYPRVYAIALELVSHTNGRLDGDTLISFVNAYQSRRFLSTAEIWSLSLMARIALIEYLRNLSDRIYQTQTQWEKVKILKNRKPEEILAYVKRSFAEASAGGASFLEHLLGELRKLNDDATAETLSYLKEGLSEWGIPIDRVIEQEHQEQASRKISMGNAITSLKTLSTMDWTEIFESLSMVDAILRQDPSEVYP
ncbi:MAG: glycosyl transferase, partial [Clostridia bacterium]|nr:glycosyl transferase [Clostridia bacterium]